MGNSIVFCISILTLYMLQPSIIWKIELSLKNADILVQNVHFIEGHCINSGLKSEKNENLGKVYCFLQKIKTFFLKFYNREDPVEAFRVRKKFHKNVDYNVLYKICIFFISLHTVSWNNIYRDIYLYEVSIVLRCFFVFFFC